MGACSAKPVMVQEHLRLLIQPHYVQYNENPDNLSPVAFILILSAVAANCVSCSAIREDLVDERLVIH